MHTFLCVTKLTIDQKLEVTNFRQKVDFTAKFPILLKTDPRFKKIFNAVLGSLIEILFFHLPCFG